MKLEGRITSFSKAGENMIAPSAFIRLYTQPKGDGFSIPLLSANINDAEPAASTGVLFNGERIEVGDEVTIQVTRNP